MRNLLKSMLLAVMASWMLSSCAFIATRGKPDMYLKMSNATAQSTNFYVNGKLVEPEMRPYNSRTVSRSSTYTVTETTYLPALRFPVKNQYYFTVKMEDKATGQTAEFLVKRDLMQGYKLWMYIDNMFTMGLGSALDLFSNSLFGFPTINVENNLGK